jgi:hypothetical protein
MDQNTSKKEDGSRDFFSWSFLFLALGVFFLGFFLTFKSGNPGLTPVATAQNYYMEPIEISPRDLIEAYLNDFHNADAKYTGKLLVVTGRIRDIFPPDMTYRRGPYPFVTIDSGPYQPIIVYLWDWEALAIANPRPGRTTSVMGFCQGVTPQLSLLDSCLYPGGCGGPVAEFYGPYFKLPPNRGGGYRRMR